MLLFEFDGGHLFPAQLGTNVSKRIDPEVMDAVRQQALEIIGRPLFAIAWTTPTGEAGPAEPDRLIAMDPSGQVVSLEVLSRLTSASLVDALARSGRVAALGWADLARFHSEGTAGLQRDWNAFRESMPPRPVPGPRLYVITTEVAAEVRAALEMLADSGVEVYEVSQRVLGSGRRFLQVTEPARVSVPSVSAYAALRAGHRPDLAVDGDEDLSRLLTAPPEGAGAGVSVDAGVVYGAPPTGDGAVDDAAEPADDEPDPVMAAIARAAGADAPLVWLQLRKGLRFEATLTAGGLLVLGDGRAFSDPSLAAAAVSGRALVDGWAVWRFGDVGPTLADARRELASVRAAEAGRPGRRALDLTRSTN